jgi:acyl carrier protein
MSDVLEDVKAVIVDVMKVDGENINLNTRFLKGKKKETDNDIEVDSMDQFFLIDGFCDKFGIEISDDEAQKINTVSDAVQFIEAHKK